MSFDLPPLIPKPAQVAATGGEPLDVARGGVFRLLDPHPASARVGEALAARGWQPGSGDGIAVSSRVVPELGQRGAEAFEAVIGGERIALTGADDAGCQAGAGLACQLIALATRPIPAVRIADAPRFAWRGLSIDIARSFFGPSTLRRLADLAASYRLNRLHLHLSDDQGWRLHVAGRPELTGISGATAATGGSSGFLTIEEYRDLDAYCAARGLVLVPEIDVPGHTNAALHASPELSPGGRAPASYAGEDVGFSRLHLALPETESFLREVFTEVAAATSGPYVHVGGDEADALGAEEYRALVTLALDAVRAAGKQPVGWQEIAPAVTGPGPLVQYWFTKEKPRGLADAVACGARVILSPGDRAYLDMKYHADDDGQDWAGIVPLGRSLDWRPEALLADDGVPADAIEGVEAAIWTEFIHTEEHLLGMLLPRLAGLAELAWFGRAIGGVADLRTRLEAHRSLWQAMPVPPAWPEHAWT